MRGMDGQRRDFEACFSQGPGYLYPAGPDWDAQRAETATDDAMVAEMTGWETAWVDLGGEG